MATTVIRESTAGLAGPALVEDLRSRVASALSLSPGLVQIENHHIGPSRFTLWCRGTAARTRFFAKVLLADPYPMPPRFAGPGEELRGPEIPQRPVDKQIATEWEMVHQMRSLVGNQNIPAPLGHSIDDRILVFEEVKGLCMNRFVTWSWLRARRARSVKTAMLQAGRWLRTVHSASLRGYETIDPADVTADLQGLISKKELKTTPYADLALKALEIARRDLKPRTSLRIPVALNHGDFSLPNLMWDDEGNHLWVIDFELSSYRPILHDLCTMIFTLRQPLLRPLTSPRVVQLLEEAFWKGYGALPEGTRTLVNGLSCARLFYHSLPRISTLRERRGWTGGLKASVYKSLLERFMTERVLRVQESGARCQENPGSHCLNPGELNT